MLPLIEAIPAWLHGLWLLAALVFMVAIAMTVAGRGPAHWLVLAGMGVEMLAQALGRPIIEATVIVVTPNPSLVRRFVIPFAIPMLLALLLWLAHRRRVGGSPTPAATV